MVLSWRNDIQRFQHQLDETIPWWTFQSEIVASSPQQLRSALLHPPGFLDNSRIDRKRT